MAEGWISSEPDRRHVSRRYQRFLFSLQRHCVHSFHFQIFDSLNLQMRPASVSWIIDEPTNLIKVWQKSFPSGNSRRRRSVWRRVGSAAPPINPGWKHQAAQRVSKKDRLFLPLWKVSSPVMDPSDVRRSPHIKPAPLHYTSDHR